MKRHNRLLSVILAVAVLLAALPMTFIAATTELSEESSIWDGTIAESYASGSGTEKDPYIISNGSQLARAINLFGEGGKYYKLDRDIYLNDIANFSSPANSWFVGDADALGYYAYTDTVTDSGKTAVTGVFNGHIDGDGNHVYGLAYIGNGSHISGLIPLMAAGSVRNLGIDNFKVRAGSYSTGGGPCVGVIIGRTKQTGMIYVDRCYVGENASINTETAGTRGGIVGYATANTADAYVAISNSYVLVSSEYFKYWTAGKCNALIGETWDTYYTIENSWSISRPLCTAASEHRVSWFYKTDTSKMGDYLKNVFSRDYAPSGTYEVVGDATAFTQLTDEQMQGANVFDYMTINGDGAFEHNNDGYPTLKVFNPTYVYVEEEEVGEVWNGTVAMSYASGNGTQNDPYIISKGSQLARAINSFGENGAYFKLDRDIYLNDIANFSSPANSWFVGDVAAKGYYSYSGTVTEDKKTAVTGAFNGHIDGNGYHVYGLAYNGNGSQISGLIPVMAKGSVKNLGIDNFKVRAGSYDGSEGPSVGIIIGRTYQTGMIEIDRCYVGANASINLEKAGGRGGIIGYATTNTADAYVAISNSYVLIDSEYFKYWGATQSNAFIGMVWDTYYTLENVWSISRPLGTSSSSKSRASLFYANDTSKMGDYLKNVYSRDYAPSGTYEVVGDAKAYTQLTDDQMKGADVFDYMTINGDGAFARNDDGYPTLKVFNHFVPNVDQLLEGFQNVGTMNADSEFTVPTATFIYSTTLTAGNVEKLTLGDYSFEIAADGKMTLVGDETETKQLTISGDVNVKLYLVGGYMVAFVNDEVAGFVPVELGEGVSGTRTGTNAATIDLYLSKASFDGVSVGNVKIQLKDVLGNAKVGGVKFDVSLTKSDEINNLGFATEYGVLFLIGDQIVEDLTAEEANCYALKDNKTFEITGLTAAMQEDFFNLRGYAKITVGEVEYYFYGEDTTVFSPIYEANDHYANEAYAEAIKAVYGASDKFIDKQNNDLEFTVFGDYHYLTGTYTSFLSDAKAIVEGANTLNDGQGADFILSLGDMSNDIKGSPELTNYFLTGKYSYREKDGDGYKAYNIEDDHDFTFFNIYGNHELELGNTTADVNPTLTNTTAAHWGDGTVGKTPVNNDYTYYYTDVNGFRIILTDTNYSYNPNHKDGVVVGWEHNLENSYGKPSASDNQKRGFDEGDAAVANTNGDSLGPVQREWLEDVLMDAVEKGIPCIVAGHASFAGTYEGGADSEQVRAIFKKANDIRTGTVIASFNGHYHTNRADVVDGVLYLDISTVRNSEWRSTSEPHYSDEHTFIKDVYDEEGNWISSSTAQLNSLSMAKQTWFANDPVFSSVKITAQGRVELTGCESSYMYNVIPEGYFEYGYPGQNSGYWNLGDAEFKVTKYAWPQQ